ncbi:MAG: hypothetical protein IJR33_08545 [Clostridia bacterium]|nr:hypothetical protein [Clostridia bacterium]
MTKANAIYSFWASFGLNAYEENSVPDDAQFPFITYELATDRFGEEVSLTASLWYKEPSWVNANAKADAVYAELVGGKYITYDGGAALLEGATPFAQGTSDPSDKEIKRIIINYTAEFLSI